MSGIPLDTELLDAKPIKRLRKDMGDGGIKDFVTQTDDELKAVISSCTLEIEDAKRQMERNAEFAAAKEVQDLFKAALREQSAPLMNKVKAAAYVLGVRKEAAGS